MYKYFVCNASIFGYQSRMLALVCVPYAAAIPLPLLLCFSLSLSPRIISLYYSSVIGVALSATLSLEAEVSSAIGATSPPSSSLDGSSSLIGTASSALLSLEAFSAFGVAEDEGDACGEIGSTRSTSALQKKHRLLLSKWRVIQLHQRQHQRNTVNNTSFETFAQIRAR